ncbi:MAG: hypothetical protein QF437_15355 [Planctomycetota bacterium]|nr:hypothetical protein [Planctomycetota bacterium]
MRGQLIELPCIFANLNGEHHSAHAIEIREPFTLHEGSERRFRIRLLPINLVRGSDERLGPDWTEDPNAQSRHEAEVPLADEPHNWIV